jgi:PAS domain S-box-containing protein
LSEICQAWYFGTVFAFFIDIIMLKIVEILHPHVTAGLVSKEMSDADKGKEQLIHEVERLRQQIAQLQASETQRKRLEEELQLSEAKYRALVDNANEIIVVVQDNMSKFSNRKAAEVTGYSVEELTSRPFADFIHPDDLQKSLENYAKRLSGEESTPLSLMRIITKSGDIKWIEFSWSKFIWEGKPALLYLINDITERKKMESALIESESRYRELAESVTDVFFAMDEKLRYTYWNKASEELLGISAKDALGKSIYDIVPDDESTRRAVSVYQRVLATKEPQHFINERSLGGRDYVFEISAYPTKDGLCVYVKDITERKKLEKALEEGEEYYRHIFDSAPFGIGISSIDGKVITLNKAMEVITGYSAEDFITVNLADTYVNRADREILLREIRWHGGVTDYPVQLKRKDGTVYDALLSIRLTTIGDKEFVQTICQDVTERKRAEEALRESEERYRALVELSPEAIFVASEGRHVFINSAGLKLFGASSTNQIIGKPVIDFIHPDYRKIVADRMQDAMKMGIAPHEIEEKFLRLDGTTVDVEVRAAPFIYEGKPAMQAVVRDISERKRAEEALRLSEENFRDSIENSPLGIRIIDEDGKSLYANRALLEMYGYDSLEELEAVARKRRYTPESYAEHIKRVNKRKHGEHVPDHYEISIVRKDGQVRYLSVSRAEVIWNGKREFQMVYQDITERKQAGEQYQTIIRTAMDGFMLADMQEHILDVNEAYCNLIGYTREELINMSIVDIEAMMNRQEITESFRRIAEIRHGRFETRHRCKDGRIIDVEVSINYLPAEGGRQFVFIRDITQRKHAEEQLQQEKERAQGFLDIAGVILVAIDADGKVTMINKKGCEVLGYEQGEIVRKNWFDTLIPEEIRREVKEVFKKLMAGEVEPVAYFENPVFNKKGEERIIAWHNVILKDIDGKIIGTLSSGEDITERKKAEEALHASEARYRLLAENVRDVIWATDMDLRFTYVSPSVKYMGDRTAEEVTSMSLGQLLAPSSQELAMKTFAEELVMANMKPLDPNRSRTLEVELIRRDGSGYWAELKMSFMRGPNGQPVGILGVMRDITERRQAEEQRRALEQKAQLASRLASVGELASGVAHEINNPLTGVIGYAELLMQEDVPKHIKNDLAIIHDGAQRVAGIVKGLLKFARQTKPERVPVNINEILEVTLRLRAYELETSNIKVTARLAPDLPMTIADPGQLQQVFLNLIINAEMEMRLAHGKGKLTINTQRTDSIIRICVKDNGPGIARGNLDKIFDPFFTTREAGQGTGLGLSICHGIVVEHGGRIWAESQPRKGATFIVELPVIKHKTTAKRAPATHEARGATRANILVVDDEHTVRQLLSQILSEEGHKVETTDDGKDALDRITHKVYDLILVDMRLPGMSGSELYECIHRMDPPSARRIALITGDVMSADTEAFIARTKVPWITKPFNVNRLKAEINRLLRTSTKATARSKYKRQKSKIV